MNQKPSISIALSGSGFLYPIHIGALKALEEHYSIDILSGTSGGSVVAGLYKTIGSDIHLLEKMTYDANFSDFMNFKSLRNFITFFKTMNGFVSPKPLTNFIKTHTKGLKFSDVENLTVCATDLKAREKKFFNSETTPDIYIYEAIMASCSIPFIYPVAYIDGIPYVDGGVTDNIPVDSLPNDGLRFAIRVVDKSTIITDKDIGVYDLAQYTLGSLLNRQEEVDVLLNKGTHIIQVSAGNYSLLQYKQTVADKKKLIGYGYKATKYYLKKNQLDL